ncbi:LysR family transcriptional regulator [Ottowia testudinis]|uniref:LysR family transcriptional regulator n=1 Tax=Ottowia testudinis TaxID=2816950 RepID=A0A975H4T6_9BURK|nr:LysR family transcriptional regulator [Ottowia testudinis]QTD44252.1 LysR family transcriptional regulator [Ottowia testudinis]
MRKKAQTKFEAVSGPEPLWQWDDVRFFLALAREGSLSAAARAMGLEHSTVSRRIAALEAACGVRLFDRLARGCRLNAHGEHLLDAAVHMQAQAAAFGRAASGQALLAGPVRVSLPPLLLSHFFVPLMPFLWQLPQVQLTLLGDTSAANLAQGEAGIALRLDRPTAPGLVVRTLARVGYGLYGSAAQLALPPGQRSVIGFDATNAHLPQQRVLEELAASRGFVLRTNDVLVMARAAAVGWGVAVLPHFVAAQDDRLHLLPSPASPLRRPLCLVMHGGQRRSERVRHVADTLADVVARHAGLLDRAAG